MSIVKKHNEIKRNMQLKFHNVSRNRDGIFKNGGFCFLSLDAKHLVSFFHYWHVLCHSFLYSELNKEKIKRTQKIKELNNCQMVKERK